MGPRWGVPRFLGVEVGQRGGAGAGALLLAVQLVVVVALALSLGGSGAHAQAPGLKSVLTESGLAYARTEGLGYLQQQLASQTVHVPDQSGEKDSIEWSITDIVISDITIPDGNAQFLPGTGIAVATSDCRATITANWHGREKIWPHPSGSGSATVYLSNVALGVNIQVTVNNGRPYLTDTGTNVNIGSVDIHFSGSHLDFLLNLLKHLFENDIKNAAQQSMATAITQEVNVALNVLLASLPTMEPVGSTLEIDYALVSPELFTASSMTLDAKGEFYQTAHPVEAPYTPTALPDAVASGAGMLEVIIGEYVPNTAAFAMWNAGALSLLIDQKMIPTGSPLQFNTSDWGSIVPPLPQKYPGWAMKALVSATTPPLVDFSATAVTANASASIEMFVVSPTTGSSLSVFTIGMNVSLGGTVGVSGTKVIGAITAFSSKFWLAASQIGNFDPTNLDQILTFLAEGVVLPYANQYLKVGFGIPAVDGLALVNAAIGYGPHYIYIVSDISYTPPEAGLVPITIN